ncbi:hypothetical protein, partial [Nonomuraea sp. NPDC049646]|uniref:hypothetical protein n=1 Tax=unclassified Nonomuraea TaxID=2593643 RepID=UPI0037AE1CCD
GGYDFIATWNSLSPDLHHPVLKVSTPRGQGPVMSDSLLAWLSVTVMRCDPSRVMSDESVHGYFSWDKVAIPPG